MHNRGSPNSYRQPILFFSSSPQLLTRAVAFMIEHASDLFQMPQRLVRDAEIQIKAAKKQQLEQKLR